MLALGTNTSGTVWTGVGRAELRGNDREGFLFFLIQVEGAAQECSSGSESRHPDGRQMLENISEQHVHFSWEGFPNIHKHSQVLACVHKRHFISSQTTIKARSIRGSMALVHSLPAELLEISLNRVYLIRGWAGHVAFDWAAYRTGCAHWGFTDCSHERLLRFT